MDVSMRHHENALSNAAKDLIESCVRHMKVLSTKL